MNEYVKFMTEQFTHYINNDYPKKEKVKEKHSYKSNLFGLLPFMFQLLWKK